MPKAEIKLPSGTLVSIDGSAEEIARVLSLYGGHATPAHAASDARVQVKKGGGVTPAKKEEATDEKPDVGQIVNMIKNSDDAERIEKAVLDRTSQVNRTLLPLYVLHQEKHEGLTLSSGEISQVMKELGVSLSQPNVSRTLSGTASKYVMADGVRARGRPTGYKLSRRGVQYMSAVISGKSAGEE